MSKENEARTYHFSEENLPHLRGIPGLIYSPLRHKNPLSSFPIYPTFNGIKVDVKEVLLPDYCKSDLIHRALASLEKNPKQDALVAALRDYAKSRKKGYEIDYALLSLVCVFASCVASLVINGSLPVSYYIALALLIGIGFQPIVLLAAVVSVVIFSIASVVILGITVKLLNSNRFNPEKHQVFEKKLEELLGSPCINEEKEKSDNLNTAERIAINTKHPSNQGVHFFSLANEEESVTIQPLSASVLPPMPSL